jgi:hypothetical protein
MEDLTKWAVDLIGRQSLLQHRLDLALAFSAGVLESGSGGGEEVVMEALACEGQGYRVMSF